MDENEFEARANSALEALEGALEAAAVEADFELTGGGILEIEFEDGSKSIVIRHGAAREISASRSGTPGKDSPPPPDRQGRVLVAEVARPASPELGWGADPRVTSRGDAICRWKWRVGFGESSSSSGT